MVLITLKQEKMKQQIYAAICNKCKTLNLKEDMYQTINGFECKFYC